VARLLLALVCLCVLPRVLTGQADTTRADSTAIGVRLRFEAPPFVLREPSVLRAPWMGGSRLPPAIQAQAWDSAVATVLDSTRAERVSALRYLSIYGTLPEPEAPSTDVAVGRKKGALGLSKKYADLGIDGQVRLEIRTDRQRNERCSPALLLDPSSGCRGGFRAPRLDNQVTLRSQGIIGRRLHLNVDYDTERDYSGNDNIQIYYQGLEDEIIRRIEIGTVTFQPPQSRFITAAIPTNNFGVNASFEVGPIQLQALAATQKGSQVADRVYTVGQTTSQAQDRRVRDLDFETSRFFWVSIPRPFPGIRPWTSWASAVSVFRQGICLPRYRSTATGRRSTRVAPIRPSAESPPLPARPTGGRPRDRFAGNCSSRGRTTTWTLRVSGSPFPPSWTRTIFLP